MSSEKGESPYTDPKSWLNRANVSLTLSIIAILISVISSSLSYSTFRLEYGSAEERIGPHRTLAIAFSGFVESNCINERNALCGMYVQNAHRLLKDYQEAIERESSRLSQQQYRSHQMTMQIIRTNLAVAEL